MKALDIVIGLVLIYFLYSLLISIIGEMIASWLGMRARLLRQGLENMLNDKHAVAFGIDLIRWIKDIFMVEAKEFKFTHAAKFYQEPGIRSLAKRGQSIWYSIRNTKPSYISRAHYATTMLSMLQRNGQGINEWDRIKFAIETNVLHFEPDTLQRFRDMLTAANGQYQLFVAGLENSYDEMMDRVNGWYKRKIGLVLFWVGFVLCAAMNVDTFQMVHILSNDAKSREEMVRFAEMIVKDSTKMSKILNANGDSTRNQENIRQDFKKVYKDIKNSETLMANGWEYELVEDNLQWTSFAGKDSISMDTMVQIREMYVQRLNLLKQKISDATLPIKQVKEIKDSIKLTKDSLLTLATTMYHLLKKNGNIFFSFSHGNIVDIHKVDKGKKQLVTLSKPGIWGKFRYIFTQLSPSQVKLWGILLSALALSLGANFWFDLLKKLVSIRSVGVKPEEKTQTKPDPNLPGRPVSDGLHIDHTDPVAKVISENRKYWEGLPGFISLDKKIKDGTQYIELVFENAFNHHIDSEISVDVGGKTKLVKVTTIKGDMPKMQPDELLQNKTLDYPDNMLYNPYKNVIGTPCGLVKNLRTGNFAMLTCAHVIKTDKNGFLDDKRKEAQIIKDKKAIRIGDIKNINLSSFSDCALIDINEETFNSYKNNIQPITLYRELTDADENTTVCKIKTMMPKNSPVTGTITSIHRQSNIADSTDFTVCRFYELIYIKCHDSYTEGGDSGALVTDSNDVPIGILIGGGSMTHSDGSKENYSMAIKMKNVLDILFASPINQLT